MAHELEVRLLGSALGAEVIGLDLAKPISDELQRELRDLWLRHQVLLFRGQKITAERFISFSSGFADLEDHENYMPSMRHPDHAEVLIVKAYETNVGKARFGEKWHSDISCSTRPSMGSVLYARRIPPIGGDTLWANMGRAFEALSPPMQRFLESLEVIHDPIYGMRHQRQSGEREEAMRQKTPPVRHPAVRIHPETGEKALFVSEWFSPQFVGMTVEESRPILDMLFQHCTRPEFLYRHRWNVDDVLIWDNRCTIHMAMGDYDDLGSRELLRTSLIGTPSGAVATREEYLHAA